MVNSKSFFATIAALALLVGGLTACDSSQNQTPTASPSTSNTEKADVPENSENEPSTPSPNQGITTPPVVVPPAPTTTPSLTPAPSIPDLRGATPAPDNSGYKSVPKDTPMKPDVGNVESDGKGGILSPKDEVMPEVKKPTPKPKVENKTSTQAKTNAVATRKAVFAKAVKLVPGNTDAKFQEYYKKLDVLVTKIEGQKPMTQESVDAVNKLNLEYPQEAMKFNDAMQKVMPNKRQG